MPILDDVQRSIIVPSFDDTGCRFDDTGCRTSVLKAVSPIPQKQERLRVEKSVAVRRRVLFMQVDDLQVRLQVIGGTA